MLQDFYDRVRSVNFGGPVAEMRTTVIDIFARLAAIVTGTGVLPVMKKELGTELRNLQRYLQSLTPSVFRSKTN